MSESYYQLIGNAPMYAYATDVNPRGKYESWVYKPDPKRPKVFLPTEVREHARRKDAAARALRLCEQRSRREYLVFIPSNIEAPAVVAAPRTMGTLYELDRELIGHRVYWHAGKATVAVHGKRVELNPWSGSDDIGGVSDGLMQTVAYKRPDGPWRTKPSEKSGREWLAQRISNAVARTVEIL